MCGPVRRRQARRPGPDRRGVPSAAETGRMAVGTLREVERSYFDLRWHMDPVAATQAGVTTFDDGYGHYADPALTAHLAALKSLASALEETDAAQLDEEIDRTALLNEMRVTLRVYERERPLAERLQAAAETAAAALAGFTHDLERWTETGTEHFALGEDGFNFRLHYEHALRDTAPELWRYGHHLKEEVQADLVERARRLDGRTPWPDLVDRLRADHPAAGDLVAAYAAEMRRAREFVAARGLVAVPDAPLEVVPTPAFMRPVIPFAAYDSPGAYSRNRTGWFYVTVPDPALPAVQRERLLRDHCRHELAATALHEGFPGHHLHLVQAQAQASHVRKNLATPLTIEGWALYCEDMMAEEGFYASEEERFFQRVHLLWRAVRVLLDVGLHTRGMTVEQAVDMMVRELHLERANAQDEVRRYCASPGYQLCYAVGRRELLRLREDFHAARGAAFTLRTFHDAILSYGGLPVTLIRWGLGVGE